MQSRNGLFVLLIVSILGGLSANSKAGNTADIREIKRERTSTTDMLTLRISHPLGVKAIVTYTISGLATGNGKFEGRTHIPAGATEDILVQVPIGQNFSYTSQVEPDQNP